MHNVFLRTFSRLRRDEKGVTLVEYGIAIVLAIVVGTGALVTLAGEIDTGMTCADTVMSTRDGTTPTC
jgi:Flp pilus assembly pilin Flp